MNQRFRDQWRVKQDIEFAAAFIGIVAVYFIAGKLGLQLAFVHASATAIWAPTGIAIAAFLLFGYYVWPSIFLGAFLVNITTEGSFLTSLGIATGNTLEGVVGAYLTYALAGGREVFNRSRTIFTFVFVVMVSATVSATAGVTSLASTGFAEWQRYGAVWFTWWLGDVAGALLVTPFIVLLTLNRGTRLTRRQILEGLVLFCVIVLVSTAVFVRFPIRRIQNYPTEFITIPVLVWAAFRFGQRGTITASLLVSGIALWGTLQEQGPFARPDPNESLIFLQAFMATLTVTTLATTAVVLERKREEEYAKALLESIGDGIIATDRRGVMVLVNAVFESLTGWKSAEVIGKNVYDLFTLYMPREPLSLLPQSSGRFPVQLLMPRKWESSHIGRAEMEVNFQRR